MYLQRSAKYPLTPLQEGIYFHSEQNRLDYLEQSSFTIEGDLDVDSLRATFQHIVDRHEILRTTFHRNELGLLFQEVAPVVPADFQYADISASANIETSVEQFKNSAREKGFDLASDRLTRICLLKVAGAKFELIWTYHHILLDGWSGSQLVSEFFDIYNRLIHHTPINLPVAKPFGEYAEWLQLRDRTEGRNYWKNYLSGASECRPIDNRSISKQYIAGQQTLSLDTTTSNFFKNFSREQSVTINHVFQAIWALLVGRYTNQNDVIFGEVVSNRPGEVEGIKSMIGIFLNTIPVRVSLSDHETFIDLVRAVRRNAGDAMRYAYTSLAEIQQISALTNLFDHIIVTENYPQADLTAGDHAPFRIVGSSKVQKTNYDLNVYLYSEQNILIKLDYNSNRFEAAFISSLTRHLNYLITQLAKNNNAKLKGLQIFPPEDILHLISDANNENGYNLPSDTLVKEFATHVKTGADKIAIHFRDTAITYALLATQIDRAKRAIKKTVAPGDIVAVYMERTPLNIVAAMACYQLQCCYLPLEKELGPYKIAAILKDATPKLVVTDNLYEGLFTGFGMLNLADVLHDESHFSEDENNTFNNDDFNSCIIYTSGSTGTPKGVVQTARTLTNLVKWQIESSGVRSGGVFLQVCSFGFDVFLQDVFFTLCSGGTIIFTPPETKTNLFELQNLILASKPQIGSFPYSILNFLFQELAYEQIARFSLKQIITYGEQLILNDSLERFVIENPSVEVHNHYGPMETFIISSHSIDRAKSNVVQYVPIGKAITNNSLFVLHENLTLCPLGVQGEIYAAGANVASGYLNLPELTSEKFINIRFADGYTRRCYRTGDLGYRTPSGELIYTGRKDRQLKMNGFRVELDDIEFHLRNYPTIRQAIVELVHSESGDKKILAYYVSSGPIANGDLRTYLNELVPVHALSIQFNRIKEIKLNKNGKVDRSLLVLQEEGLANTQKSANTSIEKIREIWKSVLGFEVQPTDNFFQIGGQSLKAMQIIGRMSRVFGKHLTVKEFYANPTIVDQAVLVSAGEAQSESAIRIIEDQYYYSASPSQEAIWLASINGTAPSYLMHATFNFTTFDKSAFEAAVAKLIGENEILRTGFFFHEGKLRQKVFSVHEINTKPIVDADSNLVKSGFDLSTPPLLQIQIHKNHLLQCTLIMHHIIGDAVSLKSLTEKFQQSYLTGNTATFRNKPLLQYKDLAAWHNLLLPSLNKSKDFWNKRKLDEYEPLDFPAMQSAVRNQHHHAYVRAAKLDKKIIREISRNLGVTPFSLLLGCVHILLYRLTGRKKFITGVPASGRTEKDHEGQLGVFINLLPVCANLNIDEPAKSYLISVSKELSECLDHQLYPYHHVLEDLTKWSPILNVIVNFENLESINVPHDIDYSTHIAVPDVKYNLNFVVKSYHDDMVIAVEYDNTKVSGHLIDKSLQLLGDLLNNLAADMTKTIRQVQRISALEKNLLDAFNSTDHPFPDRESLPGLFKAMCRRQPDAAALHFKDVLLTYRHVDQLTDHLAMTIREKINRNNIKLVALFMTPSIEMVVAIYAVLKAGAAYLPLDVNEPDIRIDYMLSEGNPALVITNVPNCRLEANYNVCYLFEGTLAEMTGNDVVNLPVVSPDTPAYVLFTSGSTGRPKGVIMEHLGLVNRIDWMWRELNFKHAEIILQKTPYTFDVSVWELFMTLCYGAKLVVIPRDIQLNPVLLKQDIARCRATTTHFVPSMFNAFLETATERDNSLRSLTKIICSGEPLHPETARQCFKKLSASLYNLYGPTEAAVDVSYHEVNPSEAIIPIGRPISNVKLHILNEDNEVQPIGLEGQIFIEGICLAQGYLNRPELTTEKFVKLPFGAERAYATGDLGRWNERGEIEYIGRVDGQIKIAGYRIELGEVENLLLETSFVQNVAVVLIKTSLVAKLICFYTSRRLIAQNEFLEYLKPRLPQSMIPIEYIHLPTLPMTTSGKVDRNKLTKLYQDTTAKASTRSSPTSDMEQKIFRLWTVLLNSDSFGVDDEFLQIGGNSIAAMRLIAQIKEEFNMEITFREVFLHSTVRKLAKHMEEKK